MFTTTGQTWEVARASNRIAHATHAAGCRTWLGTTFWACFWTAFLAFWKPATVLAPFYETQLEIGC